MRGGECGRGWYGWYGISGIGTQTNNKHITHVQHTETSHKAVHTSVIARSVLGVNKNPGVTGGGKWGIDAIVEAVDVDKVCGFVCLVFDSFLFCFGL